MSLQQTTICLNETKPGVLNPLEGNNPNTKENTMLAINLSKGQSGAKGISKEKAGIYQILNLSNGMSYIGRSAYLKERFESHERCLKTGRHHNKKLQKDYNSYGTESFEFRVIKEIYEKDIKLLEQKLKEVENAYLDICQKTPWEWYNVSYANGSQDIYLNHDWMI